MFELVPSSEVGEIAHLGLYVRGLFTVAKKHNNTRAANAAWKASAAVPVS